MTMYLVSFSGRLSQHAEAAREEMRKWGATRLWDDSWVVDMDGTPQDNLPGFVQTEAALAIPIEGTNMFWAIGRAAGAAAQLAHMEQIAPRLCPADPADTPLAELNYCNGAEPLFARAVHHYLVTRRELVWATDLCRLMVQHGSDKGVGWHTYTPFYQALLLDRRDTLANVFELGLGTNNEDVPSNMGSHGVPGASLRAWRDYFPKAHVYGADVDRTILFTDDRISTFFVDQRDATTFDTLWSALPDVTFDFFIDDGLHTIEAARLTFERSIGKVRSGGFYVIEDIARSDLDQYLCIVEAHGLPGMSINISHPTNAYDNCLVVAVAE